MKHSNTKPTTLSIIVIAILCLSTLFSCSKEEDLPFIAPMPVIEEIEGIILNRVDGSPIPYMAIEVQTKSNLSGSQIGSLRRVNSQSDGTFHLGGTFQEPDPLSYTVIYLEYAYRDNYQWDYYINGEQDGSNTLPPFNTEAPLYYEFGLYPKTYYTLHISYEGQAKDTDKLNIQIANTNGTYQYEYIGHMDPLTIEGSTKFENILSIDYTIENEQGIQELNKTIECTPGGNTDIYLTL